MGSLATDTEVHGGEGHYTATPSEDWRIWGPMGGYAASFDLVDIDLEVRRRTKRTASIAARMTQVGKPILDAQMWFAAEDEQIVHDHAPPHPHGDPFDHPDPAEVEDPPLYPFWSNLESRAISWIDDWDSWEGGEPEWDEWLRFRPDAAFDDRVLEDAQVAARGLIGFRSAVRTREGSLAASGSGQLLTRVLSD